MGFNQKTWDTGDWSSINASFYDGKIKQIITAFGFTEGGLPWHPNNKVSAHLPRTPAMCSSKRRPYPIRL